MYKFNLIDKLSVLLVLIGALNWGILGVTNVNFIALFLNFLGDSISQILQRIIYILVGVAGINIALLIYKSGFSKQHNY